MDSKKPQSIGIAYDVKRRSGKKKMAEGGEVNKFHQHASEMRKYDSQKEEKGVHSPRGIGSMNKEKFGQSKMGYANEAKDSDTIKRQHEKVMDESSKIKPKLQGLAEGGEVQKPRLQPKKHPMMVKSDAFSAKLRDQEGDLINSMPAQKEMGMSEDRGPSKKEFMSKKMAEGGSVNHVLSIEDADQDMDQHPEGLEDDNDQMKPSDSEIMSNMMAEGGMMEDEVRPDRGFGKVIIKNAKGGMIDDEMDMDHEDSIAAAIMARKDRMMAEGGQVDIDSNNEEQPNGYYEQNEDAVLKENYDKDMDDMSQPMDSNEHGHELSDEDAHDMVSKIRSVMNKNRQFKVR